jgi:hypothetical protein
MVIVSDHLYYSVGQFASRGAFFPPTTILPFLLRGSEGVFRLTVSNGAQRRKQSS